MDLKTFHARVVEYQDAIEIIKDAEAKIKAFKKDKEDRERELLAIFEQLGIQNININGKTVHLHRQMFARAAPGKKEELIAVLKAEGLGDLVGKTVNASQLSGWVREREEDAEPGQEVLPESLRDLILIDERYTVRVR